MHREPVETRTNPKDHDDVRTKSDKRKFEDHFKKPSQSEHQPTKPSQPQSKAENTDQHQDTSTHRSEIHETIESHTRLKTPEESEDETLKTQNQINYSTITPLEHSLLPISGENKYLTDPKNPIAGTDISENLSEGKKPDNLSHTKQNSIMAVLSGDLEKVAPEDIIPIITENGFVQKAISSDDLVKFFNTPTLASEITKDLGFVDKYPNNTMMSPAEVIDDYGFDKQIALSELQVLEGHLNTDGLEPYLLRAESFHPTNTFQTTPDISHSPNIIPEGPNWQNLKSSDTILSKDSASSILPNEQIRALQHAPNRQMVEDPFDSITKTWSPEFGTIQQTQNNQPLALREALHHNELLHQSALLSSPKEEIPIHEDVDSSTSPLENENLFENISELSNISLDDQGGVNPESSDKGDSHQQHEDTNTSQQLEAIGSKDQPTFIIDKDEVGVANVDAKVQNDSKVDHIRKLILEKSQILLKDGGGSLRIDLGTEHLGSIDLAIDVQDETLRLRISAESDRARDMIAQELPALRQALMDQSLDLKTVEVGVKHEQQWSTSEQGFSQQQKQEHSFTQEVQGNTTRIPVIEKKRIHTTIMKKNLSNPLGKLQLRV